VTVSIDPSQLKLLRECDPVWPFADFKRMDHVSPSMLSKFVECPREFQQRYLLDQPERPAENLTLGSAVHAAIELNMRQKIETGVDLPLTQVIEWYDDLGFAETVRNDEQKNEIEIVWDTSYEDTKTRGRLMVGEYHNRVSPRIQPLDVEGKFSVPMGLPVPVEGRYDLLTEPAVIDWKSGKQRTYKPKTAWLIQAAIYSFATGKPAEFHTLACTLSDHKVGVVTPLESEALYVNPSQTQIDAHQRTILALVDEMSHYMRTYGADGPWPTRGTFHIFACDYCSFRSDCPAWEGER
jgi:hypothetical protein